MIIQLQQLISGLSADRNPIGDALVHIGKLTTSATTLLTTVRPDLKVDIAQLGKLATALDNGTDTLTSVLNKLPQAYRVLSRLGTYGNFFNFYLCSTNFRITLPNGQVIRDAAELREVGAVRAMKIRKRFSERNPVIIGIIGSSVLVGSVLLALNVDSLPFINDGRGYSAMFAESGGLESGDDVRVAGMKVGAVSSVELDHGRVKVDFSVTDDNVKLGSRTTASITTLTLLGKRGLKLVTAGPGNLRESSTIPLSRTTPPYDLNDALSGLTTTTAAIDTASFARRCARSRRRSRTHPPPCAAPCATSAASRTTIASRDDEIHSLLAASNNVSGVLAQRNVQITTLLSDGTKVLAMLNARRQAITSLLVGASPLVPPARRAGRRQPPHARAGAAPSSTRWSRRSTARRRTSTSSSTAPGRSPGRWASRCPAVRSSRPTCRTSRGPADLEGLDTSPLCTLLDC